MDSFINKTASDYGIYIEKKQRVPSFHMTAEHSHNYCEVFFLKSGKCIYTIKDVEYHILPGEFLIVAPGDPHFTRYEGESSCERVIFCCKKTSFPEEFQEKSPAVVALLDTSCKITLEQKKLHDTQKIIHRIVQESSLPDEYSSEILRYLLTCLLLILKRDGSVCINVESNDSYSKDIRTAMEYVAGNYALPLTLESVAQYVNLSPTYFSKKFHIVTGTTFKEYLNKIRIRQARQMLLTTDDSITKIAINCGFSSSNYFKDIFHKMIGLSPRNYRKKGKENNN